MRPVASGWAEKLENNWNTGDPEDLYAAIAGVALTHNTNPASTLWDGSESGLTLSSIENASDLISFKTGGGDPPNFSVSMLNPVEAGRVEKTHIIRGEMTCRPTR